jgi:hypothetical protein
MTRHWQDIVRHKLVTFLQSNFAKGQVGTDEIGLYARKSSEREVTFNLGHIRGDRGYLILECLRILDSSVAFFPIKYSSMHIVGFLPTELQMVIGEGWHEAPEAPLSALKATKLLSRPENLIT